VTRKTNNSTSVIKQPTEKPITAAATKRRKEKPKKKNFFASN
jgi:hypothetical protein